MVGYTPTLLILINKERYDSITTTDIIRVCTECFQPLLANEENFGRDKKGKHGLQSKCRICIQKIRDSKKEEKRKYDENYRELNRDKIRTRTNEYAKTHKDEKKLYDRNRRNGKSRDVILLKKRIYYELNKEKFKDSRKNYTLKRRAEKMKYDLVYFQNNKIKKKIQNAIWRKENKDLDVIHKQRYQNKKAGLECSLTLDEWIECKTFFNFKCAYCGTEADLAQEHFIPVSKGGTYSKSNIIPSCKSCNSSKLNKDFFVWYSVDSYRYSEIRKEKLLNYLENNKQYKGEQKNVRYNQIQQ